MDIGTFQVKATKSEPPLLERQNCQKQFNKKTQNQRNLVEFSSIKSSIFCETCPNTCVFSLNFKRCPTCYAFRGASQHGKIEDVNVAVDAVGGEAGCLSFGTKHTTTLHRNLKIMRLI